MGIVAFQWGEGENILTLLMNRDNWEDRDISRASWNGNGEILSGRSAETNGTWLGISRGGRVAFLVYEGPISCINRIIGAECLTLEFLQSNESPEDFAKSLAADSGRNTKIAYHLIVADIASNSMFQIFKPVDGIVHTRPVGPGVHTLSSSGLDCEVRDRDLRLKNSFGDMINRGLPSQMGELPEIMYDPVRADGRSPLSSIFIVDTTYEKGNYGTRSTTALVVKPTNDVMFFERYREKFNENWKDHDFEFTII
ncbi:Transport and Golgi organization protein 2 [Arabidopsis suecica]|uniref:Transport and Golgi organization protein 2 n=1 Tax=Arabidopsis suecica TaxID=45249 RepID=A0A8T2CBS7_ARASU|nr:Transport and Golgi organization protein 2 [Arabidopsis suecica]